MRGTRTGGGDVHGMKDISGSRDESLPCQPLTRGSGRVEGDLPDGYQLIRAWRPSRTGRHDHLQGTPESRAQSTMGFAV